MLNLDMNEHSLLPGMSTLFMQIDINCWHSLFIVYYLACLPDMNEHSLFIHIKIYLA